jgi:hypothetical protein
MFFILLGKHKLGDVYNPDAFIHQQDHHAATSNLQKQYDEKIQKK